MNNVTDVFSRVTLVSSMSYSPTLIKSAADCIARIKMKEAQKERAENRFKVQHKQWRMQHKLDYQVTKDLEL